MSKIDIRTLPTGPIYHDDKPLLGSWAHRRPALRVNSPSVTQHLGYWIPDELVSIRDGTHRAQPDEFAPPMDSANPARDIWIARIDSFLNNLKEHLERQNIKNTAPGFRSIGEYTGRRYQAVRLAFDWRSMPVDMSIELHHEYFTISTTLDLSRTRSAHAPTVATRTADNLVAALETVNEVAKDRYSEIIAGKNPKALEHQSKFAAPYEVIYTQTWDDFFRNILAVPIAKTRGSLGTALVDFRGLVVSRPEKEGQFSKEFISPPGHLLPVSRTTPTEPFEPNESIQRAHTILPFMTAGVTGMEHTVSRFLDGRCIYATAMGTHPPERNVQGDQKLTYLMLASHGDRNQLGRLVDNIHTLGSVRMAALYDLPRITTAGDRLHRLEQESLENIGEKLLGTMGENGSDSAIKDATRDLFMVSDELRQIKQTVKGGLPYRVERSRYYRRQFDDLVTALRIGEEGRIEGFQPYNQFVKRRLGNAYDFIDMVGVRYDRLHRTTAEINQQLNTAESAKQTETAAHHQSTMKTALVIGDYFGTFFVAPGIIFDTIQKVGGEKWFEDLAIGEKSLAVGCAIAVSVAFRFAAGAAFRRESRNEEKAAIQAQSPTRPHKETEDYFAYTANKISPRR